MSISFRPLEPADYQQFADWLSEPHVARWWREPPTVEHVAKDYGPHNDTDVFMAFSDRKPLGVIQSYWAEAYPEHYETVQLPGSIGVDLLIGDPAMIGRGYGPRLLREFVEQVVRMRYPEATAVVSDPEVKNSASVRAFEKAGFTKGAVVPGDDGPEQLMVLPLTNLDGHPDPQQPTDHTQHNTRTREHTGAP